MPEFKKLILMRYEWHLTRHVVMVMVVVVIGDDVMNQKSIIEVFIHGHFSRQTDEPYWLKYKEYNTGLGAGAWGMYWFRVQTRWFVSLNCGIFRSRSTSF